MPSVISLTSVSSLDLVGEPDLVADRARPSSVPSSSAIRSATVRAAIRRGWVWPIMPAHAAAELQADLGDLGGLARAGLAGDDHDLVVADRGGDVVAALADRQLGRVLRAPARTRGERPSGPDRCGSRPRSDRVRPADRPSGCPGNADGSLLAGLGGGVRRVDGTNAARRVATGQAGRPAARLQRNPRFACSSGFQPRHAVHFPCRQRRLRYCFHLQQLSRRAPE